LIVCGCEVRSQNFSRFRIVLFCSKYYRVCEHLYAAVTSLLYRSVSGNLQQRPCTLRLSQHFSHLASLVHTAFTSVRRHPIVTSTVVCAGLCLPQPSPLLKIQKRECGFKAWLSGFLGLCECWLIVCGCGFKCECGLGLCF